MSPASELTLHDRDGDELLRQVEAALEAWDSGRAPDLRELLPEGDPVRRRLFLVELVKVDLEFRWKLGLAKQLEEYQREFPELAEPAFPVELIYEELHLRGRLGHSLELNDYFRRFPAQRRGLEQLLGIGETAAGLAGADLGAAGRAAGSPPDELFQVEVGQTLADDFQLLAELGQGSFGAVYLARQVSLQRLVAVKLTRDRGTEPQTLAQLEHPNIVKVYDQKSLASAGLRLLYMQYVEGGTLAGVVQQVRDIPWESRDSQLLVGCVEAATTRLGLGTVAPPAELEGLGWVETVCWLGTQLAGALDHAHRRGVLHRDVKPANVLLAGDATPRLADFNVSYAANQGLGPEAAFGGSLAYMSPEQLDACLGGSAEQVDARSDLYSLAIVLWELLHGGRPFSEPRGRSWGELLSDAAAERRYEPQRLRGWRQDPRWLPLQQVLGRCLSADPNLRPRNGRELAAQLHLCREPRARSLLRWPQPVWAAWASRVPLPLILLLAVLPNALAGLFNYQYNQAAIASNLDVFWYVQLLVNGIAFPLGCGVILAHTRRLWWRRSRPRPEGRSTIGEPGESTPSDDSLAVAADFRARLFGLGHFVGLLGVVEWIVAGVAYPLCLLLADGSISWEDAAHFFASLTVCGLIAAAYPFFGLTLLAVRCLLPRQLAGRTLVVADRQPLAAIQRRASRYLLVAGAVPLAGVAMLALRHTEAGPAALLSLAGLLGFGFAYWASRELQEDVAALNRSIRVD